MKRPIVLALLLAGGVLSLARPGSAQFYPGYGYGGWGGYDGGAALLGSDQRQAAVIEAKTQSRLAGQQFAAQQNAVVQGGIRSTLTNQANARDAAIANQQAQTQDWWFQHQQQQVAQRQASTAQAAEYSMNSAPSAGWSSLGPPHKPPPAAMDIIQWKTLLQDPCFASDRAKVEAPYRRTTYTPGAPPKLGTPNEDDYQKMSAAVEDMKAILQWKLSEGVDTGEYNTAKAFLNQLGNELAKRAQAAARA
jgi:hypothetical protein